MQCRNPRPLGVVRDIWLGFASSYKIAVAKPEIVQEGPPVGEWVLSAYEAEEATLSVSRRGVTNESREEFKKRVESVRTALKKSQNET